MGLCGAFLDGGRVNGLRSCVIAQSPGVSLQRDELLAEIQRRILGGLL